jgi:predicted nucleic acid-binding protein
MPAYVVVDASVAGAWSFNEPFTAHALPVFHALEAHRIIALAPDRFVEELLRVCQKKTLPPPDGGGLAPAACWERFLEVVTSPIYLFPSDEIHERAWHMAHSVPGLTTHDALYLALAERWDAELWTLDVKLAQHGPTLYPSVRDLRTTPFPY